MRCHQHVQRHLHCFQPDILSRLVSMPPNMFPMQATYQDLYQGIFADLKRWNSTGITMEVRMADTLYVPHQG